MANLKEQLNQPLPRGNSTHATLLGVIGGYLIYLAYQMVRDTLSGVSSMPMTTTVILAGLMGLAGLGVIGYALYTWRASTKASREAEQEDGE